MTDCGVASNALTWVLLLLLLLSDDAASRLEVRASADRGDRLVKMTRFFDDDGEEGWQVRWSMCEYSSLTQGGSDSGVFSSASMCSLRERRAAHGLAEFQTTEQKIAVPCRAMLVSPMM